jgi:hypothetical protein
LYNRTEPSLDSSQKRPSPKPTESLILRRNISRRISSTKLYIVIRLETVLNDYIGDTYIISDEWSLSLVFFQFSRPPLNFCNGYFLLSIDYCNYYLLFICILSTRWKPN